MNLPAISVVYRKELTEWLRDRRTLISTVLVPLLAFLILMVGITALATVMIGNAEKEIPKIMILGGEDSPQLLERLHKLDKLEVVPYSVNWRDQISNKDIRAAVEIPKGFQAALTAGTAQTVDIYFYQGELKSSFGADHLQKAIEEYRDSVVRDRLAAKNLPASVLTPFVIKQENVAPPEKVGGASVGGFIGYAVILLCLTGAKYPAIDLTAGEKERGTIETILSSPIGRTHLVLGKFLMVLTASLATSALATSSMAATFLGAREVLAGLARDHSNALRAAVHPSAILAIFLMVLPIAVLLSAGLLAIALFAKSYKEAQSYISPLMLVV